MSIILDNYVSSLNISHMRQLVLVILIQKKYDPSGKCQQTRLVNF